ncbi:FAD-dependent oxidoreductase [Pelomonas sp. KK5]|uniref:FAD-dependent oxidoreductase n=1 Tax=Pelomonas sp. KK5 TaxID=1855730 RepID=UPI00097BF6ED|nr:FAD-dependent oxidoreductase [Pelomonas sp. KK5]
MTMRVAIVGAGPAGLYAAGHLLQTPGLQCEVDLYERLPTPWGLVRAGVAPDHPEKKLIVDRLFQHTLARPELRFFGNVEVGRDVQPGELANWYGAVIHASGAAGDRSLGLAGEDLPGCWSAREFVAWYNGHPDQRGLPVDLSCERVVIVGNGNVALDLARLLTQPVEALEKTDIAGHALRALRASRVREVVLLGRRGPAQAAFNNPELEELGHLDGVEIAVDGWGEEGGVDWVTRRKLATLRELAARHVPRPRKRIEFRFFTSPLAIRGDGRVQRLELSGERGSLDAGLVLRAVGYRGTPILGLPFDAEAGVVPNTEGQVLPGVYVTGWIKRGPRGIIGSNKACAAETVGHLLREHAAGRLGRGALDAAAVKAELRRRQPELVDLGGWRTIDRAERLAGLKHGRPRIKMTGISQMMDCVHQGEAQAHDS